MWKLTVYRVAFNRKYSVSRNIDPLGQSGNKGRDIYLQTVNFVGNHLLGH